MGSRDYGRTATWYAANGYAAPLFEVDADTWVFAQEQDGALTIEDVFAAAPSHAALAAALPRLIAGPVGTLRFGFDPCALWPQAGPAGADDEAGPACAASTRPGWGRTAVFRCWRGPDRAPSRPRRPCGRARRKGGTKSALGRGPG
ncbi:hypothetical protein [Lysobacter enzymogenes]|uniref:Uncharacterized protein n=1 Tax=Lysobacter enzymogenes TaxID=69 RepID=A0A3N2RDJ1_LYSEN|nr:hypothetical protein [Lysobacter enzymogenes]ROU05513.1 hypothetical protein D9T17_17560 [Lysobacter enzymogenes]